MLTEGNLDGYSQELNLILRHYYNDYDRNHDTDQIEIQADQRAWQKMLAFTYKYLGKYDTKDAIVINSENSPDKKNEDAENSLDKGNKDIVRSLSQQCLINSLAVEGRRSSFSRKKDEHEYSYSYIQYDYYQMQEVIEKNPDILKFSDYLELIFNKDGTIKPDLLFNEVIADTDMGGELCNQILGAVSIEELKKILLSRTKTQGQVERFLTNYEETIRENVIKADQFQKRSAEGTYDNTHLNLYPKSSNKDEINHKIYAREFLITAYDVFSLINLKDFIDQNTDYKIEKTSLSPESPTSIMHVYNKQLSSLDSKHIPYLKEISATTQNERIKKIADNTIQYIEDKEQKQDYENKKSAEESDERNDEKNQTSRKESFTPTAIYNSIKDISIELKDNARSHINQDHEKSQNYSKTDKQIK